MRVVDVGNDRNLVTYTCTFCGKVYQSQAVRRDAETHCCGELECIRAKDRHYQTQRRERGAAVQSEPLSWEEKVQQVLPGEIVAKFQAKAMGGRVTSNGGLELRFVVAPSHKLDAFTVTDFVGVELEVEVWRLEDPEEVTDGDE